METNNVRNILLRVLFEPEFHNQLLNDPEKALGEYNLTDKEKTVLIKPSSDIYKYISPVSELGSLVSGPDGGTPPPPPTTVVVIIVVAIIATAVVVAYPGGDYGDIEKYRPLITGIKNSHGIARYDLVRTLINELTKGR